METTVLFPLIHKVDGKGKFFKVWDGLGLRQEAGRDPRKDRKIRFEIYRYDKTPHGKVMHSLDIDDVLYIKLLILSGALQEDKAFEDMKGGPSKKYDTGYESRILSITKTKATSGSGFVYLIKISNGPGVDTSTGTGAIKPANPSEMTSEMFVMKSDEMVKTLLLIDQWITAWTVTNFSELRKAHSLWSQRPITETTE